MRLDLLHCILYDFAVGVGKGMLILDFVDCLLDRVVLETSQVEGYHLGRAVDACSAVHIELLSLLEQVTHHLESSACPHHEVLVVHVQNGVLFVFYVVLLADEVDVVRRKTMLVEILLALYGEDGRDVVVLESEDVSPGFGVAAHIDLRGDLGEDYLIDAELIHNNDFSTRVGDLDPVLLRRLLVCKLEHSSWFSLALHLTILLDIEVEK